MTYNSELLVATLNSMYLGEMLKIERGSLPVINDTAEVQIGMRRIISIMDIIMGGQDEVYAPRDNPLFYEGIEDPLLVPLKRNSNRFAPDFGDGVGITYARRAGTVLGRIVDLVILEPPSEDVTYFIAKTPDLP